MLPQKIVMCACCKRRRDTALQTAPSTRKGAVARTDYVRVPLAGREHGNRALPDSGQPRRARGGYAVLARGRAARGGAHCMAVLVGILVAVPQHQRAAPPLARPGALCAPAHGRAAQRGRRSAAHRLTVAPPRAGGLRAPGRPRSAPICLRLGSFKYTSAPVFAGSSALPRW